MALDEIETNLMSSYSLANVNGNESMSNVFEVESHYSSFELGN